MSSAPRARRSGCGCFRGTRSASVSSSDLSTEALTALVDRAMAMAAEAPEDQYAGLAPGRAADARRVADLDSYDPIEPDPAALRARALDAESAALAVPGVTNSSGASASASASTVALATQQRVRRRLSRVRP